MKAAIIVVCGNPDAGKMLKGELDHLRPYAYHVRGQARRLIYHWDKGAITLYSFGPRQGIYK